MLIQADSRVIPLRDGCVQTVVTSPPYWNLRDYGTGRWVGGDPACDHSSAKLKSRYDYTLASSPIQDGTRTGTDAPRYRDTCQCGAQRIDRQIGLEPTPAAYVETMVEVFREVWRVLRPDGTVWLNLGDSYNGSMKGYLGDGKWADRSKTKQGTNAGSLDLMPTRVDGLKPKDLVGIPWRVAFALQADGWYLRSDIIWAKPNPMPESVTDRPTRSHEYLFLLTKSEKYFYDADAIREFAIEGEDLGLLRSRNAGLDDRVAWHAPSIAKRQAQGVDSRRANSRHSLHMLGTPRNDGDRWRLVDGGVAPRGMRNKRSVWTVNSEATPEAHFATFPQKLIAPCILAGTSEKGCCAECGSPWVRVLEKSATGRVRERATGGLGTERRRAPQGLAPVEGQFQEGVEYHTVGWRQSCSHDAPRKPCIVFDLFMGSGTTGKVCEQFGRRWVGLDLKAEYLGIARKRTAQRGLGI